MNSKKYDENTIKDFRIRLSRDLKKFSNDKHFRILYNFENDFSNAITNIDKGNNYGFKKLEILPGNVGYLKITSFENPSIAGNIATSSLNFLSNTQALIIDLRDNNGGRKAMVQLLLSYFFEETSKHLFSIYGRSEEFHGYTETYLSGKRLDNIQLYILVNGNTFSAAEMFAFILKNQKRAIIVGEKTSGGGHTIGNYKIGNGFSINLPVGKVVDAVSKESWEKVGVVPDIEITSDLSIYKAHLMALENQITNTNDSSSSANFKLHWHIAILNSKTKPVTLSKNTLKSYVGTFGRRIITYYDGKLYYQGRAGIAKTELIPINETTFRFDVVDFFRIKVVVDKNKNIVGIKGLYDDGYEDFSKKND